MINQELFDYIKQQLQQDVSKEEIKASLLNNGWAAIDIDDAIKKLEAGTPTYPRSDNQPQNKLKNSLYVGLVVVVGVGVIFGYKTFFGESKKSLTESALLNSTVGGDISQISEDTKTQAVVSSENKITEPAGSVALKEPELNSREKQVMDEIKKLKGSEVSITSVAQSIPMEANSLFFSFKFSSFKKELVLEVYMNTDKLYTADGKKFEIEKWIKSDMIDISPYQGKNVILSFVIGGDKDSKVQIDDLIIAKVEPLVVVDRPKKDEIISSPLIVKGKADARLFPEGFFHIKLVDANKNEISSTNANAQIYPLIPDKDGNMPFIAELKFDAKKMSSNAGSLIFESNGEPGLPNYVFPVRFK